MSTEGKMPENWDDHVGWDAFYASRRAESIPEPQPWEALRRMAGLRFMGLLLHEKRHRVWFAGCGTDISPFFYAYAGGDVLATDASQEAIQQQLTRLPAGIAGFVTDIKAADTDLRPAESSPPPIQLPRFAIQDFREPLGETDFDLLINPRVSGSANNLPAASRSNLL